MNKTLAHVRVSKWSLMLRLMHCSAAAIAAVFASMTPLQATAQAAAASPVTQGVAVVPHKVKGDPATLRPSGPQTGRTAVSEGEPLPTAPPPPRKPIADPKVQLKGGAASASSSLNDAPSPPGLLGTPKINRAGITSIAGPPDTVGDVGTSHYVQMVNATQFQIFAKDNTVLPPLVGGPFNFGNLWATVGGACNTNLGDPIVVFDHLADRWVLSQFAQPGGTGTAGFICIAISQTPDPTANTWFLYAWQIHTTLPDYPKFGVWPDGYYMSTYESPNLGVYVFDRASMLLGNAAGFFKTTIGALGTAGVRDTRILPADLDGPAPPAGTPNYFVRSVDNAQDPGAPANDRIEVYEATVSWLNGGTFTFNQVLPALTPAAFNIMVCNRNGLTASLPGVNPVISPVRDCIPQPNEIDTLDALSNRPMMQLKYRNFGTHAALVFNQTIDVAGSINAVLPTITPAFEVAGIRWYELRKVGAAAWTIQQEGTFAPQPNGATLENQLLHRWMGSMAIDRFGNMALGYSIVNSDPVVANSVFPGIRYSGRRVDDLPGLLPQIERVIQNGANAQDSGSATVVPQRWGDYSAMSVDPVDDCTFWFTTHLAGPGVNGLRPTRIASMQFDQCATDLAITKTSIPNVATAGAALTYRLTVTNNGPLNTSGVRVIDTLPAGVSFVAATAPCVQLPVGTLTCTLPNIPNGDTFSFDIQVTVGAGVVAGGSNTITNTAVVSADQTDSNPANNTATLVTIVAESADLRLSKTCKPDNPAPTGSNAFCTIVVENLGVSAARNVVITDTHLSAGAFTITSATAPCIVAGGVVTCAIGTLAAGASASFTVNFTSNAAVDVNDAATVTSSTPDPNPANNTATGRVSFIGVADLALIKTGAPGPVTAGTNLTYTMTVTNNGPSTAPNVALADILPAEVKLVSATSPQGSCSGTTTPGTPPPVICNLGSLVNGGVATVTVVVTVNADTPNGRILINNASVASSFSDPNNANNNATANTLVQTRADLAVVKTSDAPSYKPSSLITYTVTVTNNGPSNALAVAVTDNLPTTKQAIYLSDTGGCTKSGLTLTCVIGDMAVGATRAFNIHMTVKGSKGSVSNTANVASPTTDPTPANNSSTRIVTVSGGG